MAGSTVSLPNLRAHVADVLQMRGENNLNPHFSEVEPASYAWLDSYGIYTGEKRQKFVDSKFSLMAALCFLNTDADRFRIAMDFTFWDISFQSMVLGDELNSPEQMRSAIDAMMRAVNSPNAASSNFPLAAMIQSCFQRIAKDGPPSMVQRFVTGLDEYTNALFQEKFNRSTVPKPEECMKLRRDVARMKMWFAMLQYAHRLDLPDQMLDHESVSGLISAGTDVYDLIHDTCSYIRGARGAHPLNVVSAAVHHNPGLDLQGAVDYGDQLTRERLAKYLDIKAKLPSFGEGLDEQLARYARGIEHAMHGYSEWVLMTPFYFGDQVESIRQTGVVNVDTLAPA